MIQDERGHYQSDKPDIVFNMPRFRAKKKKLELEFTEEWEEQVFAIALRNLKSELEREIRKILEADEYDNYRNQAEKK